MKFKVTVDLQRPNFTNFVFFAPDKLKSFNDCEILGKNYFVEELINN